MVRYTINEPLDGGFMKSITIHKLDEILVVGIETKAKENGESLNMTIKKLLARALHIDETVTDNKKQQKGYKQFLGKWTDEEAVAFEEATADFAEVDERDWK